MKQSVKAAIEILRLAATLIENGDMWYCCMAINQAFFDLNEGEPYWHEGSLIAKEEFSKDHEIVGEGSFWDFPRCVAHRLPNSQELRTEALRQTAYRLGE